MEDLTVVKRSSSRGPGTDYIDCKAVQPYLDFSLGCEDDVCSALHTQPCNGAATIPLVKGMSKGSFNGVDTQDYTNPSEGGGLLLLGYIAS